MQATKSRLILGTSLVMAVILFQNCSVLSSSLDGHASFGSLRRNAATGVTAIMPLGDSITFGYSGSDPTASQGGYRTTLYQSLAGSYQLVGSQSAGPASLPQKDNEGHPGYQIADIVAEADGWLATYQPDIVLLHIGTNDFVTGNQDGAADRLGALIDQITGDDPGALVFVSSIIYINDDWMHAPIDAYNQQVQAIVAQKSAAGQNLVFVDMNSALQAYAGSPDYDPDGIHPSQIGYQKMGVAWAAAVNPYLSAISTGFYPVVGGTIVSNRSNKCVDLTDGNADDGTRIQQWDCDSSTNNQIWDFYTDGNGFYQIRADASGKCLDIVNWSTQSGAPVQEYSCGSPVQDNQLYSFVNFGSGYQIVFKNSGLCLTIPQGQLADGVQLVQATCDPSGVPRQLFSLPFSP